MTSATAFPGLGPHLRLESHPEARNQCKSATSLSPGSSIISVPAFSTVLLLSEKSKRCDACHRYGSVLGLKRCSGCASFWYCDANCQSNHWNIGHKKICKDYNRLSASPAFAALENHEKMDSLLLSTLVAQIETLKLSFDDEETALSTFMSLLPGLSPPPLPPLFAKTSLSTRKLEALFARFGNNNFSVHSHFNTYAHGIFPLASRLFNHSCMPNAAAKYILIPGESPRMEVIALRSISEGEEICLPYIDPALLQTRRTVFQLTYGFTCRCSSCTALDAIGEVSEPPTTEKELQNVSKVLQTFVNANMSRLPLATGDIRSLPKSVHCVLRETYLASTSGTFSNAAHDGTYDAAIEAGATLTALYRLVYPPNYPQIGLHLLELAKVLWNKIVSTNSEDEGLQRQMRTTLSEAESILTQVLGPEGDRSDGPHEEIRVLNGLVSQV